MLLYSSFVVDMATWFSLKKDATTDNMRKIG
jgi:hypothetical protein